jgi:hypothetical protein
MKKVNCIVFYRRIEDQYNLIKVAVKHKHSNIELFNREWTPKFKYFNNLYRHILLTLKNNNFYVHQWEEFGAKWYDIDFINLDDFTINRYAFSEE